ncbi:coiled-coil domain-containing protein [Helicobacter pylori]|uniref:coiled-coil domain-containing protein n=1 Tax=Helicobacter pylori TaxID=210 RepID=UPI001FCFA190|nr:hypothetical protein [Helicobacter pylori]
MGNLASGHFKPTNKIQAEHNDRTLSPSYLLPKEFRGQNEVNRHSKQAMILKNQIIENAHETYLITFKQKSQAKSYQWSLVVNTKETTTMSDLEKLAEHFEIKYGFQCYQIAIHRDEGYMDENNQPHINHHAHMEFITLNKENGKNMWGQINKVKLRQIQTEIAQILGMERGTDKRVSGIERIEPRKYAQMKNQERKKLEAKNQKIDELQERPTRQELETKDKEIATALDTANTDFKEKIPTLQEAVRRIHVQAEILSAIYNFLHQTSLNYVSKLAEKHKHEEVFTKTFSIVKKLKELYSKIVGKLFGDKNAKKDHQDILNAITELQERPTKQELQAKEKELNTLKQERTDLKDKLQAQEKTIYELNKFKNSSNLALDLEKAQERIQTLESNEIALIGVLYDKESIIQNKGRTINRLKKKLKELEYNYNQERERMKAENKHLQEQGLEKTYTQKDYEDLKKAHHQEVEELKKQIQETYTPTKRM